MERKDHPTPSSSPGIREMGLDPLTLAFSGNFKNLEKSFLEDYATKFLKQARYSLLLGAFLYGIFGVLDAALVPSIKGTLWFIRFGLFYPVVFAIILFSFSPRFKRYMQPCLVITLILAGLGITSMIVIACPPACFSYYAGLIIVLIFGYTLLRLRFIWATLGGWIIVAFYEIAAIWFSGTPILTLINNNFFFISANIIGMFAGYSMEYYARKDFFQARLLEKEKEKLNVANQFIRETFGRYISDDIVNSILESPKGLSLGGEKRAVTILMSDLRDFTSIAERLKPEQVVQILNTYFEVMVDVILKYEGTINMIMGDALLVIFGAPQKMPDRAQRGIACAIAMQNAMAMVNEQNCKNGLPELEMGIGLNDSEVIVGNIGSIKRSRYTVVGSGVNLTNRIQSYAAAGQVFISESLRHEAGDLLRIDGQLEVLPKGAETPLKIYEVGGIAGRYNIALEKEDPPMVTLVQQIPFQYTVLKGKHVGNEALKGHMVRLSSKTGEIVAGNTVDLQSNLRMNLVNATNELAAKTFYGKVIGCPNRGGRTYLVRFTALPPVISAYFEAFQQHVTERDPT
ncbi:MAG: adenylate/guanylate cyclase domain-containing protein [Desulfobacteraceae bacterium]|jgi:class 3 adenylate cyclase